MEKRMVALRCGFSGAVDAAALDDMELLDALAEMDKGRLDSLPFVLRRLLGEQKAAFYDCLRDASGIVRVTAVTAALRELFEALQAKN